MKNLDKLAIALFAVVKELEELQPGIATENGWANIKDLKAFEAALLLASQAKPPQGLL